MDQVALAVAGKGAWALTEDARRDLRALRKALRTRFSGEEGSAEALEALEEARDSDGDDAGAVREPARHLAAAAGADPEIRRLADGLHPHLPGERPGVVNIVSGEVHGPAVQIGSIGEAPRPER
ncbi:hypothetical protein [Nocardiopsis potens]|uniref:hypothetical protein n=1 Tax=Nocardiopsis potens TaxID=1246458 RepID=UPI000345D723|nr:hypothetical protein [Nocardiopsis potens]